MNFNLPGVNPGSEIENLFKTVGFIVVQWGLAEQSLDLMVANIFYSFDGHHLLKNRPQNLKPKIKFLEKCFAEIPELAQFRADSEKLLSRFSVAGEKRNELVHSAISDISKKDGAFIFLKIDVEPKGNHNIRSVLLAESDFTAFRKELLSLGQDGQYFAQRIFDSLKAQTCTRISN